MKIISEACSNMINGQLEPAAVLDDAVTYAMANTPREHFVPDDRRGSAYVDAPVPMTSGRTMLSPVATGNLLETAQIQQGEHVLVVGSAGGYTAALVQKLGASVDALEERADYAGTTRNNLQSLNLTGIEVHSGDFLRGWPLRAPYDVIITNGAITTLPQSWLEQITDDGRIIYFQSGWERPGTHNSLSELMTANKSGVARTVGVQLWVPALTEEISGETFTL